MAPRTINSLKPAVIWDNIKGNQSVKEKEQGGSEPKIYRNPIKEALRLQEMLDSGIAKSRADLARKLGISRARVTQILNLMKLDAEVQTFMVSLGDTDKRLPLLTERSLRLIAQERDLNNQLREFWALVK